MAQWSGAWDVEVFCYEARDREFESPAHLLKTLITCLLIAAKAIWPFKDEKQVQRLVQNQVLCNHLIVGLHIMKSI